MKGAEAEVSVGSLIGIRAVIKDRKAKRYRVAALDEKLRRGRTRAEARLLNKAKMSGVRCPTVLEVGDFTLTMSFIKGERPAMDKGECREAGRMLAMLHGADIIHGDYTPANLINTKKDGMFVIDFGLGFVSMDVEDKAVDVFTMLRSLDSKTKKDAFVSGYKKYEKSENVLGRVKDVEKRVRYAV